MQTDDRLRSRNITWAVLAGSRSVRRNLLLIVMTVLVLAGCAREDAYTMPAPGPATSDANYRLGPGDKVRVNVFGDQSLSGEYQVDGSGTFSFPLVGAIKAQGMTSKTLEAHLQDRLKEYMRDPNTSVEILSYRPFYIVGEIRNPGSYPYVDGMTVINAVAIAHGFTYRAKEDSFYIMRNGHDGRVDAQQYTRVQPGDVVIVRERFF